MKYRVFLGVYSSDNKEFSGPRRRLYFVWDNGQGTFDVQRISNDFKPVDLIQTLSERRFKGHFVHEPDIAATPPGEKTTPQPVASHVAPPSSSAGAEEVESTLREHFRKALLRSKRPADKQAALNALQTLAEVEEGIEPEHKHMFADFGIRLRRERMYALALCFCQRVLELSPQDDHAHFNAARVLLDMGDITRAEQHMLTAMDMAPENHIYTRMLTYMRTQRRRR